MPEWATDDHAAGVHGILNDLLGPSLLIGIGLVGRWAAPLASVASMATTGNEAGPAVLAHGYRRALIGAAAISLPAAAGAAARASRDPGRHSMSTGRHTLLWPRG